MTSALRETLRCVKHRATDKILAKRFAIAVEESRNLFLLSAAAVASCFARVWPLRSVLHGSMFCDLSRRFREDCGTSCVTVYTV